ncbi:spectrin beta chain, non-erythrocytic 5-like isoform X4 [Pelobates cultripes]|uniref:Spectrin beta chain, non-erythrocytic 5-like isoform X4 n=1 Tax=Pelobates cultripes TaxID=61616 RepID=A0AAD1VVV0_PELCU|nr:spectrin beta chain, non-erythrocytic 5-like isoform X4 [Pelobates cultripes]
MHYIKQCDESPSEDLWRENGDGAAAGSRPSMEIGTSQISQLSRDINQAETWIRDKLQYLRDQCHACPLQDWEQETQTIEKDIRDFEGTIMKLSQIGEHISKGHTTSSSSLQAQLQCLRDQWQLLKQTAANQSKAIGGAKTLQEFNKKADELEIWMREKEEKPSLPLLLDENFDKVRLTRQILDLKQEEVYYRNLQENINSLAQKLEKQGRAENKGPSNRRKQLNKMWLRLQVTLQEHQQSLQLALEASSLWQQADTILRAMEEKSTGERNEGTSDRRGHQDMRDIASQIMLLDIAVSQISSLHPVLSLRAASKQRQVKESWAQLQKALRTDNSVRPIPSSSFTRELDNLATPGTEEQGSVGSLGNEPNSSQNYDGHKGSLNVKEMNRLCPSLRSGTESEAIMKPAMYFNERKRKQNSEDSQRESGSHNEDRQGGPETTEVGQLLSVLISTEKWLQRLEMLLSEPAAMRSPEVIRKNLRDVSILDKEVKSRSLVLHSLGDKLRKSGISERILSEQTLGKVQEVKERIQMVQDTLRQRTSDLRDTLVLSEFMKVVQMEEERRNKELSGSGDTIREGLCDPGMEGDPRHMFTPMEELQEAVEMLNDAAKEREKAVALTKETESLQSRLSVLSQMMCTAQDWLDEITRQTEDAERDFVAVKRQTDLRDLQELFIQHQDLEYNVSGPIQLEVTRLEDQLDRLRELSPYENHVVGTDVEETLKAWVRLQESVRENKSKLQTMDQLRKFFLSYLEMISWTEDTRAQIFSDSPIVVPSQSEELERRIEAKLKDFEELAAIGWKFIGENHFLSQTIKERMEELQGMLSWVLMRWRCQKHQKVMENKMEKWRPGKTDDSHGLKVQLPPNDVQYETTSWTPLEFFEGLPDVSASQLSHSARKHPLRRYERKTHSPMSLQSSLSMLSVGSDVHIPQTDKSGLKCSEGPVWLEPKEMPRETKMASAEPSYMVSTYLHLKNSDQQPIMCQSLTVPRPSKKFHCQDQCSLQCPSSADNSSVSFPKSQLPLLFGSLQRTGENQRCTDHREPGFYSDDICFSPKEASQHQTHTWPSKHSSKVTISGPNSHQFKSIDIEKNMLMKNTDAEHGTYGSASNTAEPTDSNHNSNTSPNLTSTCRHLTLGSVVSLKKLNEEHVQKPNPLHARESDKSDSIVPHYGMDRVTAERTGQTDTIFSISSEENSSLEAHSPASRTWIEALSHSTGYCRKNLHAYAQSIESSTNHVMEGSTETLIDFELGRLSPLGVPNRYLEPECEQFDIVSKPWQHQENSTVELIISDRQNAICHPLVFKEKTEVICSKMSSITERHGENLVQCDLTAILSDMDDEAANQISKFSLSSIPQPCRFVNDPSGKHSFSKSPSPVLPEVLHPDHELLEEDDEELKCIWNNAERIRVGCPKFRNKSILDRKAEGGGSAKQVLMMAEPNMLGATFTLPMAAPVPFESVKEREVSESTEKGSPHREKIVLLDHRGPYQQKIQENCPTQDSGGKVLQMPADSRKEKETKNDIETSAMKLLQVNRKLDFQLMEGPLERKHSLQSGGRKASNRTWSVYYAVLVRRTLCFYHDRRHSKSSVSASSLHLTGAVCTPNTNYTKRNNCFCLRLSDGSEYLLCAPSSLLAHEWVAKLQHNSGLEDPDLLSDPMLGSTFSPRCHPRSWIPEVCQPIPVQGPEISGKLPELPKNQLQKLHIRDQLNGSTEPPPSALSQLLYWFPDESTKTSDRCFVEDDNVTTRRRSQSFSSVSYQTMSTSSSPQKTSHKYSVTLQISDTPAPRGRCHSFAISPDQSRNGWNRDGNKGGNSKPRNLSVFKKFFWKKE